MPWGVAAAVGGAYLTSKGQKDAAKTAAAAANEPWSNNQTSTTTLDPRIASALFGDKGSTGFFDQIKGAINQPRSQGLGSFGSGADQFLGANGRQLLDNQYAANNVLLSSQYNAPTIQGATVQAPSQNSLDLKAAYNDFIYGNPAENPYLNKALQSGINQSNQAFQTQLGDITQNLQRNVLPGIRGNAIASGQFGSSRQGIAEGNALSDFTRQSTNAAQQLGLGNIAATTGAQANAFSQGRDRSLSALQGLSGQQYGVAQQEAANRQAADNTNVNALLQTRGLNSNNLVSGLQGTQNLLGNANQFANQYDQYGINKAAQGSGLLAPFLNVGATTTQAGSGTGQSQPFYSNTGASALGGAAAGLGLYNQFAQSFGSNSGGRTGASNTNPWAFGS